MIALCCKGEILIRHSIPEEVAFARSRASAGVDTSVAHFKMLEKMIPDIKDLISEVRVAEKFLSKMQIVGDPNVSKKIATVSTLAAAQRAFGLHGQRQSRATSWQQFAKLVAKQLPANSADVVSKFRPSFCLDCEGSRDYQILAIRLHGVAEPTLALTEAVYRGSGKKKSAAKLSEVPLPSHLCVRLHLCLLEATSIQGCWVATCQSKGLSMDPHACDASAPMVLYEVPRKELEIRANRFQLQASRSAVQLCFSQCPWFPYVDPML